MKKIILFIVLIWTFSSAIAQKKAITENGDEVILYSNGTWKNLNSDENPDIEIPLNSTKFSKNKNATFLLKSSKVNIGIYLNPKKWTFTKSKNNPESEYEFQLKDKDLYGMAIVEAFEIPLETLRSLAFENGKSVAPDLKIVEEEYRIVNGNKVLLLQMNGTTQGIKFSYYGYYMSTEIGSIQLITYTSQNLLDTYKKDCQEFLNGITVLN